MSTTNIKIFVVDSNEEGNVQRILVRKDSSLDSFMTKVRQRFQHIYRHADGTERCILCRKHLESIFYDNDGVIDGEVVVRISTKVRWEQLKQIALNTRHGWVIVRYIRFHCYNAR